MSIKNVKPLGNRILVERSAAKTTKFSRVFIAARSARPEIAVGAGIVSRLPMPIIIPDGVHKRLRKKLPMNNDSSVNAAA